MIKMKKSNYIVVLFFIFIWGSQFVIDKAKSSPEKVIKYTKKLEHFSVVVAQPNSKVWLQAQKANIEYPTYDYTLKKYELTLIPSFGVRNDTLFVFASSGERERFIGTFYCTEIKSIVGMDHSNISMGYFQADTINLKLRCSKFDGNFDFRERKHGILTVEADSSKIEFSSYMYFDQINLNLNRSHLSFITARKDTILVSGTLSNYSRLSIRGWPKMIIAKDKTSYSNL